jgi:thioester reductase-like protein
VLGIQEQYGLLETGAAYHDKLIVLAGNLEDETFGLGEELFQQLGYWASCIFHIAAHVNYSQPYHNHRGANVVGTANILRFQGIGRPKRLHYMSSLSIYGPTGMVDGYARVGENDPPMKYMRSVQYDNGYAQSKWVGEKMVIDARDDGFPVTIYRPGAVFCHSQTGVGATGDFVARLMGSCIRMKCFPIMARQSKNFIPVDYLVDAVLHVSKLKESVGQSYNLVPEMTEQPASEMTEMFNTLQEVAQVRMEELPYDQWLKRLQTQDDQDPLRPLLPMLDEKVYEGYCRWQMYEKMPIYETDNLRRHLVGAPELAYCPPLSTELLRKFLIHVKLI